MGKYRFIIVGSGWRSLFYVRIAKALPRDFELCAMLCRTQEKAEQTAAAHGIHTTTSVEECVELKPDFIIVAVNKDSIADVSKKWLERGFTVLCETPASLKLETLHELWTLYEQGAKLAVAEQYIYYPFYHAIGQVLKREWIGDPYCAVVSLAHEYHGASLIRSFLREDMTPFQVTGKTFTFPTVETMSRYEQFADGRMADKKRTVAVFEFADGKVGLYDFDSEQYRSSIRHNYLNIRGPRGEIKDNKIFYLDQDNLPQSAELEVTTRTVEVPGEENPNLKRIGQITQIGFKDSHDTVRIPFFENAALASDETAIAEVMYGVAAYAKGERPRSGELRKPYYPLRSALQDSYMTILLQQAIAAGETVRSTEQPWHK